jgi:hypothetical protein
MDRLKDLAGQTITAEYVYDNSNPNSNQGIFDPSESALLIEEYRHDMLDIDMETRAMVSGALLPLDSRAFPPEKDRSSEPYLLRTKVTRAVFRLTWSCIIPS